MKIQFIIVGWHFAHKEWNENLKELNDANDNINVLLSLQQIINATFEIISTYIFNHISLTEIEFIFYNKINGFYLMLGIMRWFFNHIRHSLTLPVFLL